MRSDGPMCPHCGWPVGPLARFCGHCLKELPPAIEVPSGVLRAGDTELQNSPAEAPPSELALCAPDDAPGGAAPGAADEGGRRDSPARAILNQLRQHERLDRVAAPRPASVPPVRSPEPAAGPASLAAGRAGAPITRSSEGLGDGCDFRLAYNVARVFLAGARSAFNFRVEPCGEDHAACEDVRIRLEVPNHAALEDAVHFGQRMRRRDLDLPFMAEEHGVDIPAKVFLSYRKAGVQRQFEGFVKWDCLPAEQAARAIEHLTIQLQDISADRAARQNIDVLKGLGTMLPESRAKQLLTLKLDPVWRNVPLVDISPPPEEPPPPPPPADAVVNRLTLAFGGQLVHLLSGPCIRLGRDRSSDLICRRFDEKGERDIYHTRPISRCHARLELDGARVLLADGAKGAPSRYGTTLDGRRVPKDGPGEPVPPNTRCRITLVEPKGPKDPFALHLDAILYLGDIVASAENSWALPNGGDAAPACAVLKRTDGVRELYVIVWQGCPMWFVDERLCGLTIHRRNHAFWYVLPNSSGWLRPTLRLNLAAGELQVRRHAQYGMERDWKE